MSLSKDQVRDALRTLPMPTGAGDVVSAGAFQWTAVCEGYVSLKFNLPEGTSRPAMDALSARALDILRGKDPGISSLIVEFVDEQGDVLHTARPTPAPKPGAPYGAQASAQSAAGHRPIQGLGAPASSPGTGSQAPTPQQRAAAIPGVKNIIAVGAGKGGVGKSTIAVNLAVALARQGRAVGLMDGDIYGPSLPTLLGLDSLDTHVLEGKLQPFYVHGVKAMTIGKLVDSEKPLIWRGPMAHGAFKQLAEQTAWGELDDLIIDLPPGTGDVALTMAQMLQLTGAVVVCTPQKVAQDDAVRAARMFQQLGVEVLGVVENMSYFIADDGKEYDLFGRGGAEMMAQRLGVPFLGAVPLTMGLRKNSDAGNPSANFTDASATGERLRAALEKLTTNVSNQAALSGMKLGQIRPTLTIS
ncbi:MAG: Mrp/NBP35 family ATP-binding protein [Planctomycetota bacterium]|nr:Mrp/NBP35 family ATP-binding protein [Planctomycetota bacterium]